LVYHPYRTQALTFAAVVAISFLALPAYAGCLNDKPVCGSTKICVSDDPTARSGRNDQNSCLPSTVCNSLRAIAEKYAKGGKKLEIASAKRVNNAARGGARGSHHIRCNAADFLVPNRGNRQVQRDLANFMVSSPAVRPAGKNVYCSGRAHTSISPRENFYSSCVRPSASRSNRRQR
jgi:hypothetical protein